MRVLPLFVVLSLAATSYAAGAQHVVALLPLSNVSGSPEAAAAVESAFRETLTRRGWTVAPAEELERFLEEERIRYLDSLSHAQLERLRGRVGASAVVLGSILAYRENGNPAVALAARMLDGEAHVLWGEVVALSATDTEGMFGAGKRTDAQALARTVAARLLRNVPAAGDERAQGLRLNAGYFSRGPVTYRSSSHARGDVRRVCILPFTAVVPEASRVFVEILTVRLEATGEFDVVEPADFREAMRKAKLRSVTTMTSAELAELSTHLGTTTFLRGNVHTFRDGPVGRSEIQIDMTMADVGTGEVLWAVTHQRRGSDYSGVLQRGVVGNVYELADRLVSETIASQHRARLRTPAGRTQRQKAGQER